MVESSTAASIFALTDFTGDCIESGKRNVEDWEVSNVNGKGQNYLTMNQAPMGPLSSSSTNTRILCFHFLVATRPPSFSNSVGDISWPAFPAVHASQFTCGAREVDDFLSGKMQGLPKFVLQILCR